MAKQKIAGVLESESVLLEPLKEVRYRLQGEIDGNLVGSWVTVAGNVEELPMRRLLTLRRGAAEVRGSARLWRQRLICRQKPTAQVAISISQRRDATFC